MRLLHLNILLFYLLDATLNGYHFTQILFDRIAFQMVISAFETKRAVALVVKLFDVCRQQLITDDKHFESIKMGV